MLDVSNRSQSLSNYMNLRIQRACVQFLIMYVFSETRFFVTHILNDGINDPLYILASLTIEVH